MKLTTRTHSNRNRLVAVVAAMLLLVGLALGYMYAKNLGPFAKNTSSNQATSSPATTNMTNYDAPTTSQVSEGAKTKESLAGGSATSTPSSSGTAPLDVVITSTNTNGSTFSIRTLVGATTSSATCTLSMRSTSGKTYSNSATTQALSSNSTCKGFDIPIESLSKGENWHITLSVTDGSSQGTTEKDVTL